MNCVFEYILKMLLRSSGRVESEYSCPMCSKSFFVTADLESHVQRDHAHDLSPGITFCDIKYPNRINLPIWEVA